MSGPSHIELSAHYDHAAGNLESGNLQFHIDPSHIDLARVKTITERSPGLAGTVQLDGSGTAQIRPSEQVLISDLNASLKAAGLATNGKTLGDLSLTANTAAGRVNLALESNLAGASIQGHGAVELASGYSTSAQLTFKNVTWTSLAPLLGSASIAPRGFEAAADGEASRQRPAHGHATTPRFVPTHASPGIEQFVHASQSWVRSVAEPRPASASIERGMVRIRSAHLTGPQTNLEASGSLPLNGDSMDVAIKGNLDLAFLEKLDQSITSSGSIVLAATVRGTLRQPELGGQFELRNSSFAYASLPTGIWKASGIVLLSGDSAIIRNLAAEAGGGRITLAGSATMNGALRFGLQAHATRVRLQVRPASASRHPPTSMPPEPLLIVPFPERDDRSGHVFLAQRPCLHPSAWPRRRSRPRRHHRCWITCAWIFGCGALARWPSSPRWPKPAALCRPARSRNGGAAGHARASQHHGRQLVFFGSTYTVNNGSISFFNPIRVEPTLDLSLETQTQGVAVDLESHRPHRQYETELHIQSAAPVSGNRQLAGHGNHADSDPTLLANQPSIAQQSFQQMGESAIVGAALADPVSNQLQRVFGVTQLKINPTFAGGSDLPVAQLSLTQQISNNLTFTYVTGLNTANAETIQAVWTFPPLWSAQALRDYNGIFSVSLIYKRQFH